MGLQTPEDRNCENQLLVKSKIADGLQIGHIEIAIPHRIVQFR